MIATDVSEKLANQLKELRWVSGVRPCFRYSALMTFTC